MKFDVKYPLEINLENVNRIEVIGKQREFVKSQNTVKNVKISFQDDGETLKIFYEDNE